MTLKNPGIVMLIAVFATWFIWWFTGLCGMSDKARLGTVVACDFVLFLSWFGHMLNPSEDDPGGPEDAISGL